MTKKPRKMPMPTKPNKPDPDSPTARNQRRDLFCRHQNTFGAALNAAPPETVGVLVDVLDELGRSFLDHLERHPVGGGFMPFGDAARGVAVMNFIPADIAIAFFGPPFPTVAETLRQRCVPGTHHLIVLAAGGAMTVKYGAGADFMRGPQAN